MAAADRTTGKGAYISWTPTAGTEIVLSVDYRTFAWERSLNEVDLTAGDDEFETFGDSVKRGNIPISVLAGDEDVDDIVEGQTGSLIYGRNGNGAGARKVTIPAKVLTVNEQTGYADATVLDFTFRQSDTATVGTFSA